MQGACPLAPVTPPLTQRTAPPSAKAPVAGAEAALTSSGNGLPDDDGDPPSPGLTCRPSDTPLLIADLGAERTTGSASAPSSTGGPALASEIGEGLGWLAGSGIALLTLLIPLGSVLTDRVEPVGSPQAGASPARMAASTLPLASPPLNPQRSTVAVPAAGWPPR